MSLRTIFLSDLNALAKRSVPGLAAAMREAMVDRHPAMLDPDEHDPVATVALAWQEVAPRGRPAFLASTAAVIAGMEQARLHADASLCDWPFAHAVVRLLKMLPADLVDDAAKSQIVRTLSGWIAERQELVEMLSPSYPAAGELWSDTFRLYVAWHSSQPAWLETLWLTAITDDALPLDDAAFTLLQDASCHHPEFVTMDRLVAFWRAGVARGNPIEDLRRWFYTAGAMLEDSPTGRSTLQGLSDTFAAHLQDYRLGEPGVPWDHFVECMASAFRNPEKRAAVLAEKSATTAPPTVKDRQQSIPPAFKGRQETVIPVLLSSLTDSLSPPKAKAA